MTDTHTTAHILDEAVRAAEAQFTEYFLKNYPKDCIIYNPAWHAPKIFRAAKAAITENLPQHLSAPCAVEVDKLHWDGLVGFVGSFSYVVAPPSFTKGWRVWGKLSDKSASVGGVLITTTAADEEEAKSAAQADFERRILSCVVSKPVDVAAVREVPVSIDKLIAELKSAEDMCFSWSGSALLANELNAADTDEGHISLYKDLCGLGNSMSYLQSEIRTLSPSKPAQSVRPLEEWHEDHGNAVWWTWDNDRKEWLGEPAYIGKPLDSDWPDYHTHWTPHPAFPAAPTTEAGK